MTDGQIKHMVEQFLRCRLPDNFTPDGGISFKADYNEGTARPMKHEPVGTNLFDYTQAEAMVRHMIEGMPVATPPKAADSGLLEEAMVELSVREGDLYMLQKAIKAGDPKAELLVRVGDMLSETRALLAKAGKQGDTGNG